MLWIKRNLFVVLGGLIAGGLLAFGLFYLFTNVRANKQVEGDLEQTKATLTQLYGQNPFPSKTNITIAREEAKKLQEAGKQSQQFFTPIPYAKVTGQEFQTLLANTIYELHTNALASGVVVPSKTYAFSFEAQKALLQFAQGSFPALPEQLAEIKTICQILFDGRVNKLVNLRRPRLTTDDPPGSNDYHEIKMEKDSNTGAGSTSYIVEFQCFSPELATVLENFNKSRHGLIVRSVAVDGTASAVAATGPAAGAPATPAPGAAPNPAADRAAALAAAAAAGQQPAPAAANRPVPPGTAAAASGETLKTILNERLLKVALLVEAIKLATK